MAVLKEAFWGSISSVWTIAVIVIPLMIVLQLARDYKLLDFLSHFLKPATDFLGMSKESGFPLLVGLVFGLSYGAGVIVQSSREGNLTKKDTVLLSVFLASCHALIEDTLLFVAVGANGFVLIGFRLTAGIAVTYLVSKRLEYFVPAIDVTIPVKKSD